MSVHLTYWISSTDAEFEGFIHDHFFSTTPKALLAPLFELYPNDPAAGSPFGTGDANQLAPQFKRMAAIQGDLVFQAPRRFFLDQRSLKQPTWSFSASRSLIHDYYHTNADVCTQ